MLLCLRAKKKKGWESPILYFNDSLLGLVLEKIEEKNISIPIDTDDTVLQCLERGEGLKRVLQQVVS